MHQSYLTLKALAKEWQSDLTGAVVFDVYSQHKNELTIALRKRESEWMVRVVTDSTLFGIYRISGYNRKRANVVTLFEDILGSEVEDLTVADRDRVLILSLSNSRHLHLQLHGPKPNVFLVGPDSFVSESFLSARNWIGRVAPVPRPARQPETPGEFLEMWNKESGDPTIRLSRIMPLLTKELAAEALFRVNSLASDHEDDAADLYGMARKLMERTLHPEPCIYRKEGHGRYFSLIPLTSLHDFEEERFRTVDDALRVFMREGIRDRNFHVIFDPLASELERVVDQLEKRTTRIANELSKPGRADSYEHFGHLLMASTDETLGLTSVHVPDLFANGEQVEIPLDPLLSRVENARLFYEKARKSREARNVAESQWEDMVQREESARDLLARLTACEDVRSVERFQKTHEDNLLELIQGQRVGITRDPFRRFVLDSGWQVWVGRNAKENELLTFRSSKPEDTWLHARGVAGSHVVLRHDRRDAQPGPKQVEIAASIAAYFSKARTSHLVPVQVTLRKYVRKIRKGAPGEVRVERERVVIVEPSLPT